MDLSPVEVWTRLLTRARQDLPEQTFRTWLEPTEALRLDESTLVVGTHDGFMADWNEKRYTELLESYGPVVLGEPIHVVFEVHGERKTRSQMDLFVAPPAAPEPGAAPTPTSSPLNDRYTFGHFVVGKSNELAAAAAHAVAQAPGKVYNPLFVYGATGLGKTHLMQAIAHEILARQPGTRITFIGTEQFTNDLVTSIQTRTTVDFRRRYREIDLLLVDDVHFLRGKETTQEEFFNTFNALYEAGRQIVLTSDRLPTEIPGLEGRLVSRFQWGMVADIDLPDLEHRIAILQHKAQMDHLEMTIPEDVIRFIAEHVRSSVRELEGSIIKLLAYSSLKHREVTMELAREALRDKLQRSALATAAHGPRLDISTIQEAVARDWGVTTEGLCSKARTQTLTVPRQIAMLLTRELLGTQLVEIGVAFGGRDHSTVIHSLEKAAERIAADPTIERRVSRLRASLSALAP
ncbi:MAG TPA: chromosomal replication initiator protein DnaA [Gemmatimonadaceae bacterium]|nr:chromosomal replication initiator protein DnaA [Gemmatimonadaceae bacterium]